MALRDVPRAHQVLQLLRVMYCPGGGDGAYLHGDVVWCGP